MADTTMVLRKAHGHMHANLQEKVRKLRAVLRIALATAPIAVRMAAAPLIEGLRVPKIVAELKSETVVGDSLRADLASRGFFGRMAWAVGYVVFGIGGTQ